MTPGQSTGVWTAHLVGSYSGWGACYSIEACAEDLGPLYIFSVMGTQNNLFSIFGLQLWCHAKLKINVHVHNHEWGNLYCIPAIAWCDSRFRDIYFADCRHLLTNLFMSYNYPVVEQKRHITTAYHYGFAVSSFTCRDNIEGCSSFFFFSSNVQRKLFPRFYQVCHKVRF